MQPKYTPSENIDPTKAVYGEKSAGVLALQKSLNKKYSGLAGYTPLKEDSLYGPLTQAATNFQAPAPIQASLNPYNPSNGINPVLSSSSATSDIKALGNEIKNITDTTGLTKTGEANTKLLQDRMDALDARRKEEIAQIRKDYEAAATAQGARQGKDYAGQATKLITAGGGFLGTTGSQTGVLNNLRETHEAEKTALMGKRDAAISAAQSAYDDKQFDLARALTKEARDTEQEIYNRQKDFAEESLALAREARSAKEFDMGIAEKKVEAYSLMDDATFNLLTPAQLAETDKGFYNGYTKDVRIAAKKIAEGKTLENDIDLMNKIQTLINKTPQGQKITLSDGRVYMGMKKPVGTSVKGLISPSLATQLGVPSLTGKNEDEIILSFAFDSAPSWYKDYHKSVGLPDQDIQANWKAFKNLPDISAYAKSAIVTQRIAGTNNIWGGITPEVISARLSELENE